MTDTKTYWNERYASGGNSGYGSYGDQAALKMRTIHEHVREAKSITDIGCGDFAFSSQIIGIFTHRELPDYKGYDISDVLIEKNKERYPGVFFATNPDEYPPADLVMCIDVLFHFSTPEENEEMLQKIEKAWRTYLVISASDKKNDVSRFGEPIAKVLLEKEDDTTYLYIWKK